jgi:DNA-binding MarR family transcriptional regulator
MSERTPIAALHRFGLARDRMSAAVARATGLNATELEALEHLEERGPLTQRQLAERLFLSSGGTTLLIDRLERAGLVSRRPHPEDRRAVLLELNPAARQASAALMQYHATLDAIVHRLSATEREAVASFLEAATAAVEEATEALRSEPGRRRSERRGPRRPTRPR